ncbi:MAG: acyl carrier protein [Frankiaceae bacterium]
MTAPEPTPTVEQLRDLPRSERMEALEEIVVTEFKATLMMAEDEDLDITESFFDLGFTSLLITDIKERLEALLGCTISANVLFNSPTVERLLAYLSEDPLEELFAPAPSPSSERVGSVAG